LVYEDTNYHLVIYTTSMEPQPGRWRSTKYSIRLLKYVNNYTANCLLGVYSLQLRGWWRF